MVIEVKGPEPEWQDEPEGPQVRFLIRDTNARPHWKTYGDGHAEMEIKAHKAAPWVSFTITEYPHEGRKQAGYFTIDCRDAEGKGHEALTVLRDFLTSILDFKEA